jgi:hypothetical protein
VSNDNRKCQELFARYLEVCNQALEKNRELFPYKHIWKEALSNMQNEAVDFDIYEDRPQATYRLKVCDDHLEVLNDTSSTTEHWGVTIRYLEEVANNPEEYIHNPAKIDWGWLLKMSRNSGKANKN